MIRRACLLLAVLCISLTACSTNDDEPSGKDSEMTPDEAYAALEKVSLDLLEEVAEPGSIEKGEQERPVPCGGPGGNERNKIKYDYSASGKAVEPDGVMTSAQRILESWGLETNGVQYTAVGDLLPFSTGAYTAGLTLRKNGVVTAGGETACLDNPDQ